MSADNGTETTNMSQAIIPFYPEDTKKSRYLSFRVANFTVTESCKFAGVTLTSVRRWRVVDEQFKNLDLNGLTELRKQFANEFLDMEFSRNFRLVLQKDFQVLEKAVTDKPMTDEEHKYLAKLRGFYTPQQLAMVKQIIGQPQSDGNFDFTRLTFTISREREEIRINAVK